VIRGLKTEQKLRSSVTATVSLNQLSVVLPASGGTVSFKYDPFGRRIQKSSSSGTVNYLYDGRSLLEEVDQNWNVLARYYPEQANAWLDARASVRQSVAASADDLSLIPGRSVGSGCGVPGPAVGRCPGGARRYSSNCNVSGGTLSDVPENKEPRQTHEDKKVQKLVERIRKKQAAKEKSIPSQGDKPKQ
jgi:hypothetical protein